MPDEKHLIRIRQEAEQRKELRAQAPECPLCGEHGIVPLGSESQGATWWEHSCGAYSGIAKTWAASLLTPWLMVDPETNSGMHPKIGQIT